MVPIYMLCDGSLGTCDCKTRRAAAEREARLAKQPKHGTPYTYKNCHTKCAECRKANANRIREYRNKKKELTSELV